ncbi:STM4015 family protein [Paenibacillus sp. J5C_2022]|uniref:STM4015 family protein n=1 Tax=Paenibacillus sp. J5C2022 TaxID=2977129 RepID=UPI0021CFCDDD|nr:STM4015 family protein [Paenibacillus sp. J5C2022]MCU6708268.1 STM4015 family protein [Paenibacillus sp. J5C2022]
MSEVKLVVDYDAYEEGVKMSSLIEQLSLSEKAASLESLIIGDWGGSYENDSSDAVEALVKFKDHFPSLRKLFIGDMDYEECEVSWIMQSNMGPLLEAFPELRSLKIMGSTDLSINPARHEKLQELVIICGGLGKDVLAQIEGSQFPNLLKLELYLGVEDYGFDASLDDVLRLADREKFPLLTYLGLKNSELQDEIAIALAESPMLIGLHTLDVSDGTLSDKGAEALLNSQLVKSLSYVDMKHHYMSKDMMQRWMQSRSDLTFNIQDQQDEDEDYRYPSITE